MRWVHPELVEGSGRAPPFVGAGFGVVSHTKAYAIAMPYHVYILHCADRSFYVGMTSDLPKRLYQHQQGLIKDAYTYKRRPVEFKRAFDFDSIKDARAFEHKIKMAP